MAWIARNFLGHMVVSNRKPIRHIKGNGGYWGFSLEEVLNPYGDTTFVYLPSDAGEKLIGRHITWEDEPVEI